MDAERYPLGFEPPSSGEGDGVWTIRLVGDGALLDNLAAAATFLRAGLSLRSPLVQPVERLLEAIEEAQDA